MTGENTARMSSVLGPAAVVIGNVKGSGDFEVRGRVQGSIALSGRVHIADSGVVLGDVEATHISVAGEVRGHLLAQDGVVIASSGRVEGDIAAPRVGIEAGARVHGQLRTGGEFADRSELLQQVAPHVPTSAFVSPSSTALPLAATVPFKAPAAPFAAAAAPFKAPTPAPAAPPKIIAPPGVGSTAPAPQATVPPPSLAPEQVTKRGGSGAGEPTSNRPRKRKRPRSPFAPAAGSAPASGSAASSASPPSSQDKNPLGVTVAAPDARAGSSGQSPARATRPRPQGPPVVPTFENGAKPRPRS